ncbi:MAG: HAD family phosphatase [Lachnospiraceae bacterium]|nr:HAD family phosphatase [Lachnospiraceae bacterium]
MKAVIFDMDGVLVNTEPLHYRCWKEAFAEEGIELEYDVYKPCIGSTLGFLVDLIEKNYGISFLKTKEIGSRMAEKKAQIVQKEGFPRLSGINEALNRLWNEGYLLAVASSAAQTQIELTLKTLGMEKYFCSITSGENVKNPKPAPDTFLEAAKKLQMKPEECLVIEDSTNGGKAAHAAGMKCVWYHNPDSGDQHIENADLKIEEWNAESVSNILGILSQE